MASRMVGSTEEMLELRKSGASNKEIAEKLGICVHTVLRRIGKQPEDMTRANREKGTRDALVKVALSVNPELHPLEPLDPKDKRAAKIFALREQGFTDDEIAVMLGYKNALAVDRTASFAAPRPAKKASPVDTPVEPQKGPSEPVEAKVEEIVESTPATPQNRQKIEAKGLFEFALVKNWDRHLLELAAMAIPEPWKFANPEKECRFPETQILESYILETFRRRVTEYNENLSVDPDKIFCFRDNYCCFHTGLYTPAYEDIYACFTRNHYTNQMNGLEWFLMGFRTPLHTELRYLPNLPENRTLRVGSFSVFDPSKPIKVNTPHIIAPPNRPTRLPYVVEKHWNAALMVETAVELARRQALYAPETCVTVGRPTGIIYLLPLYMTNPNTPDVAAVLESISGGYICKTVLTLNQTYLMVRNDGRPTAEWLTAQLEHGGGESRGVITDERRGLHTHP